jgi:hypothetical protein
MGSTLVVTGLFLLFIFLTGTWLRRAGKPYSIPLVTLHKLIGLAAGIYLGLTVYRVHQATPLGLAQIAAIVVTVLLFAINVATGSLLSTNKAMPEMVTTINKAVPYLTVISTAVVIYLLS